MKLQTIKKGTPLPQFTFIFDANIKIIFDYVKDEKMWQGYLAFANFEMASDIDSIDKAIISLQVIRAFHLMEIENLSIEIESDGLTDCFLITIKDQEMKKLKKGGYYEVLT